jgi:hypothetical protein
MFSQKTALWIVLLNFSSLTIAQADDIYDGLKAKNKYDAKTVNEVRKDTVEKKRAQQMNVITLSNASFKPLAKGKAQTKEELNRMKAEEKKNPPPPDENDKIPDKATVEAAIAKAKATPEKTKADGKASTKPAKDPAENSGAVKVTTDDPDEVSFSGDDEKPNKKAKASPTPRSTKKK